MCSAKKTKILYRFVCQSFEEFQSVENLTQKFKKKQKALALASKQKQQITIELYI